MKLDKINLNDLKSKRFLIYLKRNKTNMGLTIKKGSEKRDPSIHETLQTRDRHTLYAEARIQAVV